MRILSLAIFLALSASAFADDDAPAPSAEALINSAIADIDSHRALVTKVTIPANFTLPTHYHPSEEFLYVMQGTTELRIEGQPAQILTAGMAVTIPAKAVHTAATLDGLAKVIVFRIQPNGQPVRIPTKDTNHD